MRFSKTVRVCLLSGLAGGLFVFVSASAQEESSDNKTPATLFEQLDTNKDGKLTKDEVGEERARDFNRLVRVGDKDKDGILTKEEFLAASQPEEPGNRPNRPSFRQRAAEVVFHRLDANGDGKITVAESPERIQGMVKKLLARAGKGEDGSITLEEFRRIYPLPDGRVQGMAMRALDNDRDGKLSKEELAKAVEQFDKLDRNGDGKLDIRELAGSGGGFPRIDDQTRDAERFAAGMMQRYDANNDGKLAGKEISDLPERGKARVKNWDKNSDGEVTKEEISAVFKGIFERSRQGSDRPTRPGSDN